MSRGQTEPSREGERERERERKEKKAGQSSKSRTRIILIVCPMSWSSRRHHRRRSFVGRSLCKPEGKWTTRMYRKRQRQQRMAKPGARERLTRTDAPLDKTCVPCPSVTSSVVGLAASWLAGWPVALMATQSSSSKNSPERARNPASVKMVSQPTSSNRCDCWLLGSELSLGGQPARVRARFFS